MRIINTPDGKKWAAVLVSLIFSAGYFDVCSQSALGQGNELNFKVYSPDQAGGDGKNADTDKAGVDSSGSAGDSPGPPASSNQAIESTKAGLSPETPKTDVSADKSNPGETAPEVKGIDEASSNTSEAVPADSKDNQVNDTKIEVSKNAAGDDTASGSSKVLQGYVRIVPSGTKIPIVMDTAVDSDTSQEGDEFSARTVEDLTIDGTMVIPAGSIIRGRIATLNAPKHLNRSGSVALKFDTVTTPDNRQIPLVANLVARGGVVHARRGMKDIAIDSATFGLPTLVALGIGAVAGHSSSSVGVGGGALIGAGVGAAVGLAILMAKKGKKVDVRPGDELKIELAEDLHMPAM